MQGEGRITLDDGRRVRRRCRSPSATRAAASRRTYSTASASPSSPPNRPARGAASGSASSTASCGSPGGSLRIDSRRVAVPQSASRCRYRPEWWGWVGCGRQHCRPTLGSMPRGAARRFWWSMTTQISRPPPPASSGARLPRPDREQRYRGARHPGARARHTSALYGCRHARALGWSRLGPRGPVAAAGVSPVLFTSGGAPGDPRPATDLLPKPRPARPTGPCGAPAARQSDLLHIHLEHIAGAALRSDSFGAWGLGSISRRNRRISTSIVRSNTSAS